MYILPPSIPKRIEGYRWQSFAPPAAGQIPPLPWTNLSPPDTLILFLPMLAVGARRLHDIGKSGWWQLIALTIIGIILLIVWWATNTKFENSKFGEVTT